MLQNVLTAVQAKLLELRPITIRYVAEDWGQLDFYDNRPPVDFPCALLDAAEIDFSDFSRRVQHGNGKLTVRVADNPPINRSGSAPDSERQFNLLGIVQCVYVLLQGFNGENFTGLTRTSLRKAKREDSIKEYEMQFMFSYTDDAAYVTPRKVANVEIGISTEGE